MRRSLTAAALAAALLLTTLLTACSEADPSGLSGAELVDYSSSQPSVPPAEGERPSARFVDAAADFGFSLLRRLPREDAVMISPLSLLCALGMTANGARGETLSQMESALFGGMAIPDANRYMRGLLDTVPGIGPTTLKISDSLWLNRRAGSFSVDAGFLNTNAAVYDADVFGYNFAEGPARINDWISAKTDGMIPSLLDVLGAEDLMVLTNAVLFDGKWRAAYEEQDIRTRTFTSRSGVTAEREMLFSRENSYFRLGDGVGFLRPYDAEPEQTRYSFVGLLPDEGVDVYDYLNSFTGAQFVDAARSHLDFSRDVYVMIPSMEFDTNAPLTDLLAETMPDAFDPEAADFSGMGTLEGGNLALSLVMHKTRLELSREGTKAAAATAVLVTGAAALPTPPPPPIEIYLTRPFLFAIVETSTCLPVFCGIVTALH